LTKQTQCTLLYMVEEKERLLRSHGLDDPFVGLKQDENQVALVIYSLVAEELDALWDGDNRGSMSPEMSAMLLRTFECALAGNLFDAGAAAAVADVAFCDVDEDGQVDCKDPLRMAARDVERAHRRIREKVARPKGGTWRYDDLDVRTHPSPLTSHPSPAALVFPAVLHGRVMSLPRRYPLRSLCFG